MARNQRKRSPGISRIDQPSHRTHGFFVRVSSQGRVHSAFFADRKHGGRARALAAAQKHYRRMRREFKLPRQLSRRWNAEIVRRKGRSGIQGVRRMVSIRLGRLPRKYWVATWSPEPGRVRKKWFSIRKHGEEQAMELAIRARRAGVRSMK